MRADARRAAGGRSAGVAAPPLCRSPAPAALAARAGGWLSDLERESRSLLQAGAPEVWDTLTRKFEAQLIHTALEITRGRRIEAAQKLGIGRNTITRKIQLEHVEVGPSHAEALVSGSSITRARAVARQGVLQMAQVAARVAFIFVLGQQPLQRFMRHAQRFAAAGALGVGSVQPGFGEHHVPLPADAFELQRSLQKSYAGPLLEGIRKPRLLDLALLPFRAFAAGMCLKGLRCCSAADQRSMGG